MSSKTSEALADMANNAAEEFRNSLADRTECYSKLNALNLNQDVVNSQLQNFYQHQQAVNQAAIQEFNQLRNRTAILESQSEGTREFIKTQKQINRMHEESLQSLEAQLKAEKKKKRNQQTVERRQFDEDTSFDDRAFEKDFQIQRM